MSNSISAATSRLHVDSCAVLNNRASTSGNDYLASTLTTDDWNVLSAEAGHKVGPDANGHVGMVPITAGLLADARQNGRIPSGEDVSAEFLQSWVSPGQSTGLNASIERAVEYARNRDSVRVQMSNSLPGFDTVA